MKDTLKRSLAKSLSWRALGIAFGITLLYHLTGDLPTSTAIVLSASAVKTVLYLAHERMWERIRWGRSKC